MRPLFLVWVIAGLAGWALVGSIVAGWLITPWLSLAGGLVLAVLLFVTLERGERGR